ncbi:hypothetical protein, partial [Fictibacillus sp. NRS-1165]|uniref:hypothetical protein n=1 Tax=Fictibacillus sp. NRS-1165 TaxID=3144463 RepID=UPI003D1C37FC
MGAVEKKMNQGFFCMIFMWIFTVERVESCMRIELDFVWRFFVLLLAGCTVYVRVCCVYMRVSPDYMPLLFSPLNHLDMKYKKKYTKTSQRLRGHSNAEEE